MPYIIACMHDFIKAIFLGIVEGITEFLPVSSTGHLILVGQFLQFSGTNSETFDIAIQLGAILAVFWLYRAYFIDLFHPKKWFKTEMNKLLIACLPALILGAATHKAIKLHLFSPFTVACALIFGGIVMIIVEKWIKLKPTTHTIEDISYKQAFIIGCFQCFALWPGMSRSASTIIGGLAAKLDYETSAKFSFIVAVPVMTAAVGYDLLKSYNTLTSHDIGLIGIGFVTAFIVAWVSIVGFLSLLKKWKLFPFAVYRILLGVGVIIS
jgi:undecaprenyl-diphosphatase